MADPTPPTVTEPVITLRAPSTASTTANFFTAPTVQWITGTWHVTHSTLPMWKKSRNVAITYKPMPASSPSATPRLDDLVTYQSLTSNKQKTVSGIDTPAAAGSWDWRGNGWLKIASSHWEVLGFGGEEGGEQWVVTYFAKTIFTPAGVDIYSRKREGLGVQTLASIREALNNVNAPDVKRMAGELFEVKID